MKAIYSTPFILAALIAPGYAMAQTDNQSAATSGLAEIVVTAQKRSENLQDVPIAITAKSGDELASQGVTDTMQLNMVAPGLNIRADAGAFQPSIRGIGTSSTVVENPVALYIDGVYYPQQREGFQQLEDIEQISVLKGPQGTLFGRNATAGVIQITTKVPSFTFGGKVHADFDNYETLRVGGYVTGGLSDSIAASLSANYADQGQGWGDNLTNGNDTFKILHEWSVRGKLLFQLSDTTDVTFAGDYTDWKRLANSRQPYPGTSLSFPGTGPLGSVYDTYGGVDAYNALKGGGVSMTINHESDAVRLVSITTYRDVEGDYVFDNSSVLDPYFIVRSPNSPSQSFSQEFQVISNAMGPFDWMFGLYYFNYDNGADPIIREFSGPFTPTPASASVMTVNAMEKTESVAPFGEVRWEFSPGTRLTAGVRYTYEKRTLHDAQRAILDGLGATTTTLYPDRSITANEVTYRLALDYELSRDILAYASFNTGFKSGGFNTVSPWLPSYDPEKLKAYEIGLKTELLDRRLRLNLAAFYYDYTNLQVIQFIGLTQAVVNGPGAELYGLDVDFQSELTDGLSLSGGFEILHAEFTDYPGAVFSSPNPGGGATIFPGDATGNRLPLAQEFTGTLALDYHKELSAGTIDFNLTANYNGDYYFHSDNLLKQDDYTIINASLKWTFPDDRLSLSVWGKNLADEKIITTVTEQGIGYPTIYGSAPCTYGVGLAYKF